MLAAKRLSTTASSSLLRSPQPQLYLTHARTSLMVPIAMHAVGPTRLQLQPQRSPFSSSRSRSLASEHSEHGEHGDHYDAPGGWLWGLRPGEKYEKEGWEGLLWYGVCGSLVVTGVAYAFKEDTSIQTWALEEARRRLEKEGLLEESSPSK